ncbi:ETC complex I subunit region [Trichostrongylus colubriformis]|uniref:NADH dehydrogenase [ubiquinone] iron-sulfur protein 4, mitochondrial n=1 Tax=Trichostrongylus colubriformis TaxID=6319 RepID=A0AAN8ERI5_TRICO
MSFINEWTTFRGLPLHFLKYCTIIFPVPVKRFLIGHCEPLNAHQEELFYLFQMIRSGIIATVRQIQVRTLTSGKEDLPVVRLHDAKRKEVDEIIEPSVPKVPVTVTGDEAVEIGGRPVEHTEERTARIFRAARESTQAAWGNTKAWRIELDNRQRWENPLMGWCSSGDPLSNISMNLKFASKEDAIAFCEKNRWTYEVEKEHERKVLPKNYASNFAWNKKTRALLNENSSLIKSIRDYLSMGRTEEAAKYQQLLHRNLIHLAQAADQSLLPQLRDENPPNDENCVQPTPSTEAGPPPVVPPPVSAPYPVKPHQPTPPTMMAPPMVPVQPQPAPVPTSQPQMGMPIGPPQGYGYPPQGMHPGAPVGGPQVMPAGYPPQGYDQSMMYSQQQPPQQPQQQYMR